MIPERRLLRPLRVCITGGIACGKSLVAGFFKEYGIAVIEADEVCHDLIRAGAPLFREVVEAFGREIVGPDGEINRRLLGRRVFGNPADIRRLDALLHPAAKERIEAWFKEATRIASGDAEKARPRAAAVIPLLYEAGWEAAWDWVICVASPETMQKERLLAKGLTGKEALERMEAQWPVTEKMKRADQVIFNSGTMACARKQAAKIIECINQSGEKRDAE